jgi:hypothetical protein
LTMVNERLVPMPFSGMVGAPKLFTITGGAATVSVAVAALPVPPLVEVTTLVVLTFTPAVVPVTLTEKVQLPLAGSVAPVRLIVPEPAIAVMVPPSQAPLRPLGVATTSPEGSVSVKATPVSATVLLGLTMVNEVRGIGVGGTNRAGSVHRHDFAMSPAQSLPSPGV